VESGISEDESSYMGLVEEPYKDEGSPSEYDPETTPLTYIYKNLLSDLVFEEFEDLGSKTPECYTLSQDSEPPTSKSSSDDE
jgi:hypothetical protein